MYLGPIQEFGEVGFFQNKVCLLFTCGCVINLAEHIYKFHSDLTLETRKPPHNYNAQRGKLKVRYINGYIMETKLLPFLIDFISCI